MPKSSTASRTPSARSSSRVPTVARQVDQQQALGDLQDQVGGVQAAPPQGARAPATRPGWSSSRADRLTLTVIGGAAG